MGLLTVTEAAALYGCTRPNIWYLMKTGRLPYQRVGSVAIIRGGDLNNLIANRDQRGQLTAWIEAA